MLNLNDTVLDLGKYENGDTQNIECKLGRKLYMIDISKNYRWAEVMFYKKLNKDRKKYSKYGKADLHVIYVKPNACLNREIFENIAEINKAQCIRNCYYDILV